LGAGSASLLLLGLFSVPNAAFAGDPQVGSSGSSYQQYNNDQYGGGQYGNQQYGNDQYGNQQYGNQQYSNDQYGNQQYGSK
jgi:hypothetical protein